LIPVYILQGRHDLQACHDAAKHYLDLLQAPTKRFYSFENSAHYPMYEEADRFNDILINEVKKQTE
jgi:pimeloyl-ACP methyl ester carboxylesterase